MAETKALPENQEGMLSKARAKIHVANKWWLGLGVFMVGFFILCVILEIQTSENAVSGLRIALVTPQLSVLLQPYLIVAGQMTAHDIVTSIWGWGTQITYFACIVGLAHFHKAIAGHNNWLAKIAIAIAIAITIYNCVSDYNYVALVIQDFGYQLGITALMALGSGSFGLAGVRFIELGLGRE